MLVPRGRAHRLAWATGTRIHSFIARPFIGSKGSTPLIARALARSSGPSLNVIASPNVPANTLSPTLSTGIPNICERVAPRATRSSASLSKRSAVLGPTLGSVGFAALGTPRRGLALCRHGSDATRGVPLDARVARRCEGCRPRVPDARGRDPGGRAGPPPVVDREPHGVLAGATGTGSRRPSGDRRTALARGRDGSAVPVPDVHAVAPRAPVRPRAPRSGTRTNPCSRSSSTRRTCCSRTGAALLEQVEFIAAGYLRRSIAAASPLRVKYFAAPTARARTRSSGIASPPRTPSRPPLPQPRRPERSVFGTLHISRR